MNEERKEKRTKKEKIRGHPGLNQGPLDLQSNALPLSYTPCAIKYIDKKDIVQFNSTYAHKLNCSLLMNKKYLSYINISK